jgi:Flp pilus assembly protein TadD
LFAAMAGLATVVAPLAVDAAGGAGEFVESKPVDPDYAGAVKAIETKDWNLAVELLARARARDDENADIQNYLGYAERNRGNMDAAFKHYEKALVLNPKHRGAHEYVGEAYLLTGNLKKAEEHLAALDKLCFLPCEEYTELKEKVAEYKKKQQARAN